MGRIVFLTNIDRQYVMMDRAKEILLREGRLQTDGHVVFLNDKIIWGPD